MDFKVKEKYDINDLIQIVRILRSPDGCPWDKVQTHESIRKDFIEEVYEAVDAIDNKDVLHLREELGDVLLQVVFHSVIETENNNFSFEDVADEISKKMIIRHPHVFGDVTADTTEQVLRNWDEIKMKTHSQKDISEAMNSVSKTLPSLMRAEKLQKKAKRGGICKEKTTDIISEIKDRLDAVENSSDELRETVIGELLFSVVKLSSNYNVDSEQSLYNACNSFTDHFRAYEAAAQKNGIDIQDSDTKVTNQLWKEIPNHKIGGNSK